MPDRSVARIENADLLRLAALAADAEAELFRRNPDHSGRYAGRLLGRALCQGAALHYVNGQNGVKDFDSGPSTPSTTTGPSRLAGAERGTSARRSSAQVIRPLHRQARRSPRAVAPVEPGADPAEAIRRYLAARRTRSAKELAAKAVVLIYPEDRVGEIVWPIANHTS